jgi:imidazolonepropionase-like amidohydrolase
MHLRASLAAALVAACSLATTAGAAEDAASQRPGAAPADKVVVYRGATLLDASGSLRPNMSIVARGERIEAIVPAGTSAVASDAQQVDVAGLYAIPGLIDAHVHLASVPNRAQAETRLRRALYGGITAVRDMAGDARAIAELARAALTAEIAAPDIHFAATVAGPSFFGDPRTRASAVGWPPGQAPWMQAITPETDLVVAIARARGTGASGIKIYADLPAELVRKITAEAHRQGIQVWAHGAVFPATAQDVVDAGVDVVSHIGFVSIALAPQMPQQFREMGKVDFGSLLKGYREPDARLQRIFDVMKQRGQILDATVDSALNVEAALPGALDASARMTHQAFSSGVAIAAGTDRHNADDDPFPPLYVELELLANKVGMPPVQVLRAATVNGARTIGQERDMGTLEAGKLANIVFLARNPLEDIRNLRSVTMTVKRGARHARQEFQPAQR